MSQQNKTKPKRSVLFYSLASILWLIIIGLILPERLVIPVRGASSADWNHQTFWYYPWGKSGVHKGIDIFAPKGTDLLSASDGIVIYTGKLSLGGNVIAVLGAKWHIHYYAHLERIQIQKGQWLQAGQVMGSVGDSGNAKGKPAHVHYSIMSLLPYIWHWGSSAPQAWKKMFYLNPSQRLLTRA